MDRPGSTEEIQLVAILRNLKKSQDEVAQILKMRKERVGDIEKWLRTAPLDWVEGPFVGYRLQKVIDYKLTDCTDLHPRDLVQAARLTPEAILEYYRKDYSAEPRCRAGRRMPRPTQSYVKSTRMA